MSKIFGPLGQLVSEIYLIKKCKQNRSSPQYETTRKLGWGSEERLKEREERDQAKTEYFLQQKIDGLSYQTQKKLCLPNRINLRCSVNSPVSS